MVEAYEKWWLCTSFVTFFKNSGLFSLGSYVCVLVIFNLFYHYWNIYFLLLEIDVFGCNWTGSYQETQEENFRAWRKDRHRLKSTGDVDCSWYWR